MKIAAPQTTPQVGPQPVVTKPAADTTPQAPVDQVTTSSERTTPPLLKAGKIALTLAAATGVGALGYYAGTGSGTAHIVAGIATGGLAGFTGLGVLGLFGDVMGGFMSNKNNAPKVAALGAVLGGVGGAFAQGHPLAGAALALGGGLAAGAICAATTNILQK